MDQKLFKYIKWFLPVLFITYYCHVTIFMHAHVEDGMVVIHSHPFSEKNGGASHHHNSLAEILFFHDLSTIQTAGGIMFPFQLNLFAKQIPQKTYNPVYPDYLSPIKGKLFLRAPPTIG